MPGGIPYIIGNEAAERFSYYGMKGILIIFMLQYLMLMQGSRISDAMSNAEATSYVHLFASAVYFFPIFGAILSDILLGKYRTILTLSVVYCLGHAALAVMGYQGVPFYWMVAGLALIAIGSGGIKPCVSAHVGDQFGKTNSYLLSKVFGWFYFSINTGAFLSTLLIPWLLEWYGPHWAFGIPGVLMAIATVVFWMGRKVFIHVPPGGWRAFFGETFSREGISALGKLGIIYLFVAVFWALFDQMGSSWVLQAEDMDRRWLVITWLSSQIQAVNPILILAFIPLFQFIVYPAINKVFPLTPMRKISIGLFVMVGAFATVAFAQERIDTGEHPSIGWQVFAYALLTAAEVMVSITCLEFSYTQAPRKMKSVIMALFLMSVSLGNLFTAAVNGYIIVPEGTAPATRLVHSAVQDGSSLDAQQLAQQATENGLSAEHAGDGIFIVQIPSNNGTEVPSSAAAVLFNANGELLEVRTPENSRLEAAFKEIAKHWEEHEILPLDETGAQLVGAARDQWGNPLHYDLKNNKLFLISSLGPDGALYTVDDIHLTVTRNIETEEEKRIAESSRGDLFSALHPEEPWLERRRAEKGALDKQEGTEKNAAAEDFATEFSIGGGEKLSGAAYFWFFAQLMLVTACLFVIVAWLYKPREYLQEEATA
jgi:POT family proton-dependent oligopeptide transporter